MTDRTQFMRKTCPTCQVELPSSAFNKRRTVAGTVVLASKCRECQKSTAKAWREAKRSTPLRQSAKKMAARNPRQYAARRKRTAAFHRTPAFIAAGEKAHERSGGRCEHVEKARQPSGVVISIRCEATEKLERHCKRYPKTRPIEASDIAILCDPHHDFVEMTEFGYRHQGVAK